MGQSVYQNFTYRFVTPTPMAASTREASSQITMGTIGVVGDVEVPAAICTAAGLGSLPVPGRPGVPLTCAATNCSLGVLFTRPMAKMLVTVHCFNMACTGKVVFACD